MKTKKYSSYKEIENELEILNLQREIDYQKLVLSFEKTKQNLQPKNLVTDLLGFNSVSNTTIYSTLFSAAIPFVLEKAIPVIKNWISKKKRGD